MNQHRQDYIGAPSNSYTEYYVPAEFVGTFRAQGGRLLRKATEEPIRRGFMPLRTAMRPRVAFVPNTVPQPERQPAVQTETRRVIKRKEGAAK